MVNFSCVNMEIKTKAGCAMVMYSTDVATSYLDHIEHRNWLQTPTQRRTLGKTSRFRLSELRQVSSRRSHVGFNPNNFCEHTFSVQDTWRVVFIFAVSVSLLP